ncbi:putative disease resistance protein RGA3 [Silene latifolia]|uniref:putative disease resistance protein RGA3 n=1 Tax=Silene latifolia TaxID=37657 RepID=UPI003D77803D
MAESIVAELVKTIADKVGSEVCKTIVGVADIESQIKGLQDIKNTIEATLLDADSAQVCTHSQRDVLEKLELGIAKLIDFQDAKAAKAKQKELMGGSKFTKEVRLFFSTSNQLVSPFKDARKIKGITEELSRMARNHAQFGSIVSSSSLNQTRTLSNVSGSYMSTDMVIGRDGDMDKMVSLLLDTSTAAGVLPVASIVGMGGVGKTTLAQYVYNDERIKRYFDLQLWVSATQVFNVKDVLRQMVTCATDEKALDYDINQLQRCLYQAIVGKRFLLCLDDVWDDDSLRAKWLELRALLRVGAEGSQVLLTTRSTTAARIIGTQDPYMVTDLGNEDSLLLLRHVAVTEWHEPGVETILKEISDMCPKVPLAIRAIGSLLAGKHTVQEWRAFRKDQLANFASYGRDVMGTLRLSYHQLDTRLKLCVLYCSLFPKGYDFHKRSLIHLWIAMGYVEGEYTDQNPEEVAEGYVLCLLNRGFFYCHFRDGHKCPNSFYMHNLMHDLVLSIAGYKYKIADSDTNEFDERVCHVSFRYTDCSWRVPSSLFKIKQLKSFLLPIPFEGMWFDQKVRIFPLNDIYIPTFQSLRALRMHGLGITELPRSLGKLIQLRYLDFSKNALRKLPDSITQLVNLYVLDLSHCRNLEELPQKMNKLVALRHLYLFYCDNLSHMPKGLRRLTSLKTLGRFVVGKPRTSLTPYGSKAKLACDLADLGCLCNLKGKLTIVLGDRSNDIVSEAKSVNLDKKEITKFTMDFRESRLQDEMVLENLKPGADLEDLSIKNYGGKRLPCWMREGIHLWLPNLVSVRIVGCKECINMCSFGRLPHLEYLSLESLDKVEYIENGSSSKSNVVLLVDEYPSTPLFLSLRRLTLTEIPRLKGWWSMIESVQDQSQNQLLKCLPPFPKLEEVEMDMELVISLAQEFLPGFSSLRHLTVRDKTKDVAEQTCGTSNVLPKQRQPVILLKNYLPKLQELYFFNNEMEHIPEEFRGMSSLEDLRIFCCTALEAVPEWIDSLTSLKSIDISYCPRLKSLPREMSNLSNLTYLRLEGCSRELTERCQSPSGEDWPKIQHIPTIYIQPPILKWGRMKRINQS